MVLMGLGQEAQPLAEVLGALVMVPSAVVSFRRWLSAAVLRLPASLGGIAHG